MDAPPLPRALLSRVEDAGLNASAPPQQRWIDGWLVRYSPGKARRARSVNAVAPGRLPLAEKLRLAGAVYDEAGLTMHVRITPFSHPQDLDNELAVRGWARIEETRVMVRPTTGVGSAGRLPPGTRWTALDADSYAEAVGMLRGSTGDERRAHAQRLRLSPTPYRGFAVVDAASGAMLACGQFAREGGFVGLYDIFTAPERRRQGLAALLCERMLSISTREGANIAYLQVGAENHAARRVYHRLGFADGYGYHYRIPAGAP